MADASTPAFDELAKHERFVRGTLRGLLRDEAEVQDTLQDTWLRVLRRPAGELERLDDPAGWLARVARNLALSRRRAEGRRELREHAAAERASRGTGPADTPEQSLARVETRQRVVAAVLALGEPYRSVVVLRYEQGLRPAEIAARVGRSEGTVRSQLARGHQLLRAKLDREFGDRRAWAALALPLRRSWAGAPLAAAAGCAAAALGWAWWSAGAAVPARPALAAVEAVRPEPVQEPEPTGGGRTEVPGTAAIAAPGVVQEEGEADPAGGVVERLLPRAVLLDRAHYADYERATFSLLHGRRDDPGNEVVRNDWDLQLERDRLRVRMVTDDRSLIAALGSLELDGLAAARLPEGPPGEVANVVPGHAYFVWTVDTDSQLASFVRVHAREPGRSCELDWYTTDGTGRGKGSFTRPGLAAALVRLRDQLRLSDEVQANYPPLRQPKVRLMVRTDSNGNPHGVDMAGGLYYVRKLADGPLDLAAPIEDREDVAWAAGGWIPEDVALRVTRVDYAGYVERALEHSAPFEVVLGGMGVVRLASVEGPVHGTWTGELDLFAGDEPRTNLSLRGRVAGEAILSGVWVDRALTERPPVGFGAPNRGFWDDVVPAATPELPKLEAPRALLQAWAGAGGGNPNRVDLGGRTSIYVDEVREAPLDLSRPPEMRDPSLVHVQGGYLAQDRVFVVTAASWRGGAPGDANGGGEVRAQVAGHVLVEVEDSDEPLVGSWSGRLRVLPGEESRTHLTVGDSSWAELVLSGHFEPRR